MQASSNGARKRGKPATSMLQQHMDVVMAIQQPPPMPGPLKVAAPDQVARGNSSRYTELVCCCCACGEHFVFKQAKSIVRAKHRAAAKAQESMLLQTAGATGAVQQGHTAGTAAYAFLGSSHDWQVGTPCTTTCVSKIWYAKRTTSASGLCPCGPAACPAPTPRIVMGR